ncbi:hypothetical protein EJ05DRAFT_476556 [Pseudovirgaria hyperparasitica]|uniref:Uncharacterized protein n=1 Tax=Pseudovirgaria hyperparasitica TaxID=470096 RepID=A0A6A6W2W4_9PEZI|nr:uncharacterized protein EJ05DRAFT_476556 [Pseudovirgaria hyperparasitica]KAF2757278.1 hypothetical protein EJ05DRAFT_476556 [Pseudovirgaria hyperparasitica]
MTLEISSLELPPSLHEELPELPGHGLNIPTRPSSIAKNPRLSDCNGYSDGFTEYMTFYGGYGGIKTANGTNPVKYDSEKLPRILDDGLIPTESENTIQVPDGLQYVEPAQGLESVHSSGHVYTKATHSVHELSTPTEKLKYTLRPPTRSKTHTPQSLAPLFENAELDGHDDHHHHHHISPIITQPTPLPPTTTGHAVAQTLLHDLSQDLLPKKPSLSASLRSTKSIKSRFPLLPRRSFSCLFRRDSERKKSTYSPATLGIALQQAAHSGNISLVASLVTLGARATPVPQSPTRYRDALSCAAVDGHTAIIDYLVHADCGVDQESIDAAFLEACYAAQVDMAIRLLRNYGASLETRKMTDWEKIIQDMPEEGGKHIVSDRSCYHALAILPNSRERDRLLRFLVSCDDFNKDQVVHHTFVVSRARTTRHGDTRNNQTFVFENQRISVHCYKYTAISLFTSFGFISGVQLLLEYGIKTSYSAAEKKKLASTSGPDSIFTSFPTDATSTPDPISCISDHNHLHCPMVSVELLGLLLCNGADPHIVEHTENDSTYMHTQYTLTTPLLRAIAGRNLSALNILLSVGVKQSTDDHVVIGRNLDVTPLGLAIEIDDVEIVKILLENGWKQDWIVGWGPMKANGSRQVVSSLELARRSRKHYVLNFLRNFNNIDEENDDDEAEINSIAREIVGLSGANSTYSYYGI